MEYNEDIEECTEHMFNVLIPQLADELLSLSDSATLSNVGLCHQIHNKGKFGNFILSSVPNFLLGINLRHMGKLWNLLWVKEDRESSGVSDLCLVEMVCSSAIPNLVTLKFARALKNILRAKWRKIIKNAPYASTEKCVDCLVDLLNSLLHNCTLKPDPKKPVSPKFYYFF